MSLIEEYRCRFPLSASWALRAETCLAGGGTHDAWEMDPFPVFFKTAQGAIKWSAEERPFVDYWMGHGALLCGHNFAPVAEAIGEAARRGLHFGGPNTVQVEWAEQISAVVPSADRVRFTASGSEATLLAFRVARAVTGRNVILRFDGHFHGWHDQALAHLVDPMSGGLAAQSANETRVATEGSLESAAELLDGSVAAVILEPGGGASGALPWSASFLRELSALAHENGSLAIFDETVSGFRCAPGGIQALSGVTPDLTVLGKIMCGGLPGGAVAGKSEYMDGFGRGLSAHGRVIRIPHSGTFNANPLTAAAGLAMLKHAASGIPQTEAAQNAEQLVAEVNQAADEAGVDVGLYQGGAVFHILIGARAQGYRREPSAAALLLPRQNARWYSLLRKALLLEGVDTHPVHGWVSTAHTGEAISATRSAFARAFRRLKAEGIGEALAIKTPEAEYESCVTTCPDRACACRQRVVAGCNLPLREELQTRSPHD